MILPNFLIVGAQKSGTTSLHDILKAHPQTNMSETKEINFFTNNEKLKKGLNYYSTFFKQDHKSIATGESSPGYICYPNVHKLIHQYLGEIKIVIILRDPIKRALSQYWDNRRHLTEVMSESQIIDNYLETEYSPNRRGYFSRGVYYNDVKKYIDLFGANNVHVLIFEDLIKNQKLELHRLYDFLGLDTDKGYQKLPKPSNTSLIWNNPLYKYLLNNPEKTKYIPVKFRRFFYLGKQEKFQYPMLEQTEIERLKKFYKPWNQKLENLISIKLDLWM